ncbi:hypothetical protein GCM10010430_13440 [Kitasatospora cystarginea]|uniref:Secreted protein n=1 Tax=Kitasatospora cystarginea TaxID=58350 RepID=A0ABN3DKC9_9ACTN
MALVVMALPRSVSVGLGRAGLPQRPALPGQLVRHAHCGTLGHATVRRFTLLVEGRPDGAAVGGVPVGGGVRCRSVLVRLAPGESGYRSV